MPWPSAPRGWGRAGRLLVGDELARRALRRVEGQQRVELVRHLLDLVGLVVAPVERERELVLHQGERVLGGRRGVVDGEKPGCMAWADTNRVPRPVASAGSVCRASPGVAAAGVTVSGACCSSMVLCLSWSDRHCRTGVPTIQHPGRDISSAWSVRTRRTVPGRHHGGPGRGRIAACRLPAPTRHLRSTRPAAGPPPPGDPAGTGVRTGRRGGRDRARRRCRRRRTQRALGGPHPCAGRHAMRRLRAVAVARWRLPYGGAHSARLPARRVLGRTPTRRRVPFLCRFRYCCAWCADDSARRGLRSPARRGPRRSRVTLGSGHRGRPRPRRRLVPPAGRSVGGRVATADGGRSSAPCSEPPGIPSPSQGSGSALWRRRVGWCGAASPRRHGPSWRDPRRMPGCPSIGP